MTNKIVSLGQLGTANAGRGTQEQNILFAYSVHKHFRY